MKKFLLAAGVVIVLGLYIVFVRKSQSGDAAPVAVQPAATTTPDQPAGTPPPQQTPTSTPTPKPAGLYKDGTYTGIVADAFYGPMQVQAIIQGGKLADVKFLQYPNDPGHTTEVSNTSLPRLKSEAIRIQGAKVDIISGATQTTEGFQQSLASALSQAKA